MDRAVKTPQILELSGIGNPSILEPLGIETKISLPGCGEKMQDHQWTAAVFGESITIRRIKAVTDACRKLLEVAVENFDSLDAMHDPEVAEAQAKLL